ncbi:hypothetical protein RIF29_11357 [Crotalaria pallida]|uniref:Uncharacterized protein n=1 Tax=Crotalaria pallida TaxID=3830 RepID=A0AAN9P021_CROPI
MWVFKSILLLVVGYCYSMDKELHLFIFFFIFFNILLPKDFCCNIHFAKRRKIDQLWKKRKKGFNNFVT